MATAGSLRRRIRKLEGEIAALREQQDETRRAIEQAQAQRTKELRAKLKRELDQSRAEMRHDFDSRADQLRAQLFDQMERQAEELRAFDARAQRERQAKVDELTRINDELAAELEGIRSREQQRTEASREMAEEIAAQAQEQQEVVDKLPHDFFCAGQLDVFSEHLQQVQTFLAQGMCEAAASSAEICLAELEILEINVRQMQREWEELFSEYQGRASKLHELMKQFENSPVGSPMGDFMLIDEDRADWSRGEYGPIHDEVERSNQLARGVEEAGDVTAFLRGGTAPKGRQMVQAITGLQRLADRLMAVITCISKELFLSDGREMLADQAAEILASQGYAKVSGGYRGDDPLDSYVLDLSNNGIDIIRLTFVPVREDGVAVRNMLILSLDIKTTPGLQFVQKLARDIASRLEAGYQHTLRVTWDGGKADEMKDEESARKAVPDMRLLVRRIERKHQQ